MRQKLLVIVPPHAVSMGNGPPMAPFLLRHHLQDSNIDVEVFDANAYFFRWLLEPGSRQEVCREELSRIERYLQRDCLTSEDLTSLGQLLAYRYSNYSQNKPFSFARSGIEWAGVSELLLTPVYEGKGDEWAERMWAQGHELLLKEILSRRFDSVAFSVLFHPQVKSTISLGKSLRQHGFAGKIIIGGAVAKLSKDPYLQYIVGESGADLAFTYNLYQNPASLISYIGGRIPAREVQGGAWPDEKGALRRTPRDMSVRFRLPGPLSYEGVDLDFYQAESVFPVLLSEGCYWGLCEFCDYPYLAAQNENQNSVLFRNPADVVADIVTIHEKYGVRGIDLISDAVPLNYFKRLRRQEVLKSLPVYLECSIRAERYAKDEHFQDMAACNVDAVTVGVESLCDDVLEGMKKGNTYEDVLLTLRLARDNGIQVKANMIYDYPRMGVEHVRLTRERLREIAPLINSIGIHSFGLTPRSPMAMNPAAANLRVLESGSVMTDHGEQCLPFERLGLTDQLSEELQLLYRELTAISYELEMKNVDSSLEVRTLMLPFQWDGGKAMRSASPDIMLQLPGKTAPFMYFIGEYAAA